MGGEVISPDKIVANADWSKRYTWSIPADTPEELYRYLAQRGMSVAQFRALPVFQVNRYLIPWLADIRQPEDTMVP